jgi:23S rRNA (guanine745-N1)-methyltransferase
VAGALACRNRHSFDLAREGYVNLLVRGRRRPAEGGDRLDQLRHRAAFLEAGHFEFITAAIRSRLQLIAALPTDRSWRVLEAAPGRAITSHASRRTSAPQWSVSGSTLLLPQQAAYRAAGRILPLPWPICGSIGRCTMLHSTW